MAESQSQALSPARKDKLPFVLPSPFTSGVKQSSCNSLRGLGMGRQAVQAWKEGGDEEESGQTGKRESMPGEPS